MIANEYAEQASQRLGSKCTQPIEVALLVHRGPDTGGRGLKKVFGKKTIASALRINNLLVVTPTHVRLFTLGGRSGLVPKNEIGEWTRGAISVGTAIESRHSYFASSGTSMDQTVHRLHLTAPDLDLTVDVMANAGLDVDDHDLLEPDATTPERNPTVEEGRQGLREISAATDASVRALVAATDANAMRPWKSRSAL